MTVPAEQLDHDVNTDALVSQYIKLRNRRAELKAVYEENDKELSTAMEEIANELNETLKQIGAEALSTPHGTAFRVVKTRYWSGDWDALKRFVMETNAIDLLERRVHQSNMKQWLEEHPGQVPPGLNIDSKYDITVRKK
jgi:hypothetical protein